MSGPNRLVTFDLRTAESVGGASALELVRKLASRIPDGQAMTSAEVAKKISRCETSVRDSIRVLGLGISVKHGRVVMKCLVNPKTAKQYEHA